MTLSVLLPGILRFLLISAAVSAVVRYTSPNRLNGAMLSVLILGFQRIPISQRFAAWPWVRRLAESKAGIPYGVAPGLGALRVLPDTELFRLVVS